MVNQLHGIAKLNNGFSNKHSCFMVANILVNKVIPIGFKFDDVIMGKAIDYNKLRKWCCAASLFIKDCMETGFPSV